MFVSFVTGQCDCCLGTPWLATGGRLLIPLGLDMNIGSSRWLKRVVSELHLRDDAARRCWHLRNKLIVEKVGGISKHVLSWWMAVISTRFMGRLPG